MADYIAQDGEMVDAIVHAHYGYVDKALEAVHAANPHLRELPEKLPMGTKMRLPELSQSTTARLTRLWDK